MSRRHHHTRVLDLTRPLDASLEVFSAGEYHDPPLEISPWASINEHGFWVSRLGLGTQTGTHIDAPAHFAAGGVTLEQLDPGALIGGYLLLDLWQGEEQCLEVARREHRDQRLLLLRSRPGATCRCSQAWVTALLELAIPVWVLAGTLEVRDAGPYGLHQLLAAAGVFLVEDLAEQPASEVRPGGTLIALPLHLTGVSGAPCRVVVLPAPP